MYFHELQDKLIDLARERVHAGQFTERGLARLCLISQPHMHHVLKKMRTLSAAPSDRLMRALDLDVPDLLWRVGGEGDSQVRAVPIIHNRIGPGSEAIFTIFRGNFPMPAWLLTGLVEPVTAWLAPDLVLPAALAANDMVLLDQNPAVRAAARVGIWIVAEAAGLRARYLVEEGSRIYVANQVTRPDRRKWLPISSRGGNILDVVRARIVWTSRKMETEPPGPIESAGA